MFWAEEVSGVEAQRWGPALSLASTDSQQSRQQVEARAALPNLFGTRDQVSWKTVFLQTGMGGMIWG